MSGVIEAFSDEYRRYRHYAESAIAQVSDDAYLKILGDASIAMYVEHLGGNLRSRFTDFLTTDGEKPDRDRDSEFEFARLSRPGTLERWQDGWRALEETLATLNDSQLAESVTIRGQKVSVSAALARSLAHVAYHVGQIVLLAKIHLGANWQTLTIPRGGSSEYNKNPNKEFRK